METFAFTHVAVNYEDPQQAPSLREFDLTPVKKAAAYGVAGSAAALAMTVSAPDAHAALRQGNNCGSVSTLQAALNNVEFSGPAISVDGSFGPNTEAKVRAVQAVLGLSVDGVAGPQTATSLGIEESSCGGGTNLPPGTAVVTASALNVRYAPSTASTVYMSYPQGTVIGLAADGETYFDGVRTWIKTRSGFWVAGAYIST